MGRILRQLCLRVCCDYIRLRSHSDGVLTLARHNNLIISSQTGLADALVDTKSFLFCFLSFLINLSDVFIAATEILSELLDKHLLHLREVLVLLACMTVVFDRMERPLLLNHIYGLGQLASSRSCPCITAAQVRNGSISTSS